MKSSDLSLCECSISYSTLKRSFVSRTLTTTSDTLSTNWRTAHLIRPHKFDEKSSDQIFYFSRCLEVSRRNPYSQLLPELTSTCMRLRSDASPDSLDHYFLYLIVHLWNKSPPQDLLYLASLLPIQRVNSLS
jgi:hypothetical protein